MDLWCANATVALGHVPGCSVAVYLDAPKPADIRMLRRATAEVRTRMPELSVVHLNVLRLVEMRTMDPDARAEAAEFSSETKGFTRALATLLEAEGLIGGIQRSVLTGIQLLARSPFPTKVFDEPAPAVAWLRERARDAGLATPSLFDVEEAIASLEARAREHAP